MTINELKELKQLAKENDYYPHGKVQNGEFILAFAFGYRIEDGKKKPGISNEQLAEFIEKNLPRIPIITQFEISNAFKNIKPVLVIREHREKGKYLDSKEIIEQALEYTKAKGWIKAIVVTHPAMEARNDYACTGLGMQTIAPGGLKRIMYDPKSEQKWTRDSVSWWKREEEVIDFAFNNGWLKKPIYKIF